MTAKQHQEKRDGKAKKASTNLTNRQPHRCVTHLRHLKLSLCCIFCHYAAELAKLAAWKAKTNALEEDDELRAEHVRREAQAAATAEVRSKLQAQYELEARLAAKKAAFQAAQQSETKSVDPDSLGGVDKSIKKKKKKKKKEKKKKKVGEGTLSFDEGDL
eukprot:SAG11_NODE_4216_length_2008_cov_2.993190_2_plen_160_part_00